MKDTVTSFAKKAGKPVDRGRLFLPNTKGPMKTNVSKKAAPRAVTHEGGRAVVQKPELELERTVMSCLLFEDTYYERGSDIGARLETLCSLVKNETIYDMARRARSDWNLRHVPLWLLVQVARKEDKSGLAGAMAQTIQRPDEISEFLSMYWKGKRTPIAAQVKKGLARAFGRFSAEQLSKWNRDSSIRLRDVMFLTHPKPEGEEQAAAWKRLASDELPPADTWEVALSAGKNKKETWERLLSERKLGIMALLMNLRNMDQAKVDHSLVRAALRATRKARAFPYRFLSAAKHAPWLAQDLSDAMLERIAELPKLRGTTYVVVDVSGSMDGALSSRGDATRIDAASSVAICCREVSEACRVFTFSQDLREVRSLRGLALADGIDRSQIHGATYLGQALTVMGRDFPKPDRIIVITDEQAHDNIPALNSVRSGYIVNVAPYKPALPTRELGWARINGWSDRLVDYIAAVEHEDVPVAD